MKYILSISLVLLLFSGCKKDELFSESSRNDLWLINNNAKLPIVVEGNTKSKNFVILLHGGPGGSAQVFNNENKAFTDPLESQYAMVYYDQRNAGLALGKWDEESLTIEQHIDDLDQIVELLKNQYGSDIQLFLAGHSWGGYLGTNYLLDPIRASKIKAWINISGLIHRNLNNRDALDRIDFIGSEQINNGTNSQEWQDIMQQVQEERNKGINQYDVDTEDAVFDLIKIAEVQIFLDKVLEYESNFSISSVYKDNYDPLRMIINGNRDRVLVTQMYELDKVLDVELGNITLPTISIYGFYDVRTPIQQGEYLLNKISTAEEDKALITLNKSDHQATGNESRKLAEEVSAWIEKYK